MFPALNLSSLAVKALVLAGIALAAFLYGLHVKNAEWNSKMLSYEEKAQEQYAQAVQKANDAEAALNAAQAQAAQKNADLQKKLAEIEKRPQYAKACLDQDGINAANDALSNHASPSRLH